MHVKFLETLDWSILIAYFLILIAIGIWASSKRKKGSSLFLAENSLKWYHIGFSMWGTNVGPSMLIASASAGFTTGIVSGNYAWYALSLYVCLLLSLLSDFWVVASRDCRILWENVSDNVAVRSLLGIPLLGFLFHGLH